MFSACKSDRLCFTSRRQKIRCNYDLVVYHYIMIVTNIDNKFCKKACKTSLENILQTRIYTEAFPGRKFVETKVKIHQTKTLKTKNFIERNEQKKNQLVTNKYFKKR